MAGSSLNYLPNPHPIPAAEPVFGVMLLLAVGPGLVVLAAVSADRPAASTHQARRSSP